MKKTISILLSAVLLISCLALAGCGEKSLKKYSLTNPKLSDGKLCYVIEEGAEGDLVIPDKVDGKLIGSVKGGNNLSKLKSLTVECDVTMATDLCNSCNSLESVTFKGNVDKLQGFNNCPALTGVRFEKKVKEIDNNSFTECTSISEIVVPDGTKFNFYSEYDNYGATPIITESAKKYISLLPVDEMSSRAEKARGTAFDESKKISEKEAKEFADKLNAPVYYSTVCADCSEDEYSIEKVPKEAETDHYGIDRSNHEKLIFTEEKRNRIEDGSDHIVYCLAEPIKGAKVNYSVRDSETGEKIEIYYKNYRLSFWDYNDGTLLGWLTVCTSVAPQVINPGDNVYHNEKCGDTSVYFLDSTPLDAVIDIVYG